MKGEEREEREKNKDSFSKPRFSVPLLVRYRALDKLPDVYVPTVSPNSLTPLLAEVTWGHKQWRFLTQGRFQDLKFPWA